LLTVGGELVTPSLSPAANAERKHAFADPDPDGDPVYSPASLNRGSDHNAKNQIELDCRDGCTSGRLPPAAEVHETPEAYEVVLELPGVDKAAIEVKATERTLVISAERRQRQLGGQPSEAEAAVPTSETATPAEKVRGPLLSEFRYGTWSRSFRFPVAIEREQLQAVYRDGLLTVTAPKANKVSTVTVKVEG
jgi:HSP20 family protein